ADRVAVDAGIEHGLGRGQTAERHLRRFGSLGPRRRRLVSAHRGDGDAQDSDETAEQAGHGASTLASRGPQGPGFRVSNRYGNFTLRVIFAVEGKRKMAV